MPRASGRDNDAVARIAGPRDDPAYTPQATELRAWLEGMALAGLTDTQLDRLECVLAGGLSEVMEARRRRRYHVRDWDRGGPPQTVVSGRWWDHASMLVDRVTGAKVYLVSCQSSIDGSRMPDFA
jgi:hypothetical protein